MDRIQRKYVKWILELEKVTPNYILEDKCKLINISLRGIKSVVRYEEKARTLNKKVIKNCIMEMDKRIGEGEVSRWERRRETLDWAGISERELKETRVEENEKNSR